MEISAAEPKPGVMDTSVGVDELSFSSLVASA